jgi:hypothetical protein
MLDAEPERLPSCSRAELVRCLRGEECYMHGVFSEIDESQRCFLLMLTDFGIAVCSAKLIVHLIILV